jgi:signal peptidase II
MEGCGPVNGFVSLLRVHNAGSFLGFTPGLWLWTAFAGFGLILIPLYSFRQTTSRLLCVAAGLQAGGALGNLLDRLLFGAVTDFLSVGHAVIINLADVALVAGMLIAVIVLAGTAPKSRPLTVPV